MIGIDSKDNNLNYLLVLTIGILVKYRLSTLVINNIQNMAIGKYKDEALYFIQRIERMALVTVLRLGSKGALRATGVESSSFVSGE